MKIDLKNNKTHQQLLAAIMLTILVLIAYQGSFDNNFVGWDDNEYVINNDLVINHEKASLKDYFNTVISLNYHPLTILSMSFNDNTCTQCPNGISARPFITGNIILHLFNTILVLILIFKLSNKNILISFLVAAIFGVHPMHVESVAWVSERKDVLYSFFFLAGLISYIIFKKKERNRYFWLFLTFILFVFSCLSKAMAVVFPVILILIDFLMSDTEGEKSIYKKLLKSIRSNNIFLLIPFFAVSIFFGSLAVHIQNGGDFFGTLNFVKDSRDVVNIVGPLTVLQKLQIASYGFFSYLFKFLFPFNLSILYPYPSLHEITAGPFSVKLWISLSGIILLAIATIWSVKKTKLYFFGLGFYLVTIIFVLQFIGVGTFMMAERYTYLPYIGFAFIPASLIAGSSQKVKNIFILLAVIFIITMMILTRQQVNVWYNSDTLWSKVIEKNPNNELARRARGKYYYMLSSHAKTINEKKKYEDKALVDFNKAIKAGTRNADVFEGMGVICVSRGDLKNALIYLNVAISIDPEKGKSYYNRGMILDQLNKKEEAIENYNLALQYGPEFTLQILSNRSVLYLETGKYDKAKNDLDRLISMDSKKDMFYHNRAFAKIQLGDIAGAIDDYNMVLQLNPDDQVTKKQLQILLDNSTKR